MHRSKVLQCLAGMCLLLAVTPSHGLPSASGPSTERAHRLRFELIPFTTPQAKLLALDSDGTLREFVFEPGRRHVAGVTEGRLGDTERRRLDRLLSAADKRWFTASYPGEGLTAGDQFRLWLEPPGGDAGETWGFIGNAPPGLQSLLAALRSLPGPAVRLAQVPPSAFYVRARRVAPERLDDLERNTAVRIVRPATLPTALQPLIHKLVADPLMFHPFPPSLRKDLLDHRSLGNDVYLRIRDAVFELQLYTGN